MAALFSVNSTVSALARIRRCRCAGTDALVRPVAEKRHAGRPVRDPSPVRLFVMGINQWRDGIGRWPRARGANSIWSARARQSLRATASWRRRRAARTRPTVCLRSAGSGADHGRRGLLRSEGVSLGAEGPAHGGKTPRRAGLHHPTATKRLEVIGPVQRGPIRRHRRADTDFTAKLVDVFPDGPARKLTDGILRRATASRSRTRTGAAGRNLQSDHRRGRDRQRL